MSFKEMTSFRQDFSPGNLKPAEKNYSVSELECLAIVDSLKHFEYFVYGKDVLVVTDHKPCLALMDGTSLNKRLLRFALSLQTYQATIIYKPGKDLANADAMSRQCWTELPSNAAHGESDSTPGRILAGGDVGGEHRQERDEEKVKR